MEKEMEDFVIEELDQPEAGPESGAACTLPPSCCLAVSYEDLELQD